LPRKIQLNLGAINLDFHVQLLGRQFRNEPTDFGLIDNQFDACRTGKRRLDDREDVARSNRLTDSRKRGIRRREDPSRDRRRDDGMRSGCRRQLTWNHEMFDQRARAGRTCYQANAPGLFFEKGD
jgi:hypothetical protein